MQEWAEAFYKSGAWVNCRRAYAKQHGYLCERCLDRGIFTTGEIVHHKIHLTQNNINNPEITLNPENLMLVCRECHGALHRGERRFTVDELGRVTAV